MAQKQERAALAVPLLLLLLSGQSKCQAFSSASVPAGTGIVIAADASAGTANASAVMAAAAGIRSTNAGIAAAAASTSQAVRAILLRREKFINRELEIRKNRAGILCLAGGTAVRAVAARQTDIKCRHQQLDVTLQTDDGELPQRDKQLVALIVKHQIVSAKAMTERARHLTQRTAAAIAAGIRLNDTCIEQNRVNDFNCSRLNRFFQRTPSTYEKLCQLTPHPLWIAVFLFC